MIYNFYKYLYIWICMIHIKFTLFILSSTKDSRVYTYHALCLTRFEFAIVRKITKQLYRLYQLFPREQSSVKSTSIDKMTFWAPLGTRRNANLNTWTVAWTRVRLRPNDEDKRSISLRELTIVTRAFNSPRYQQISQISCTFSNVLFYLGTLTCDVFNNFIM